MRKSIVRTCPLRRTVPAVGGVGYRLHWAPKRGAEAVTSSCIHLELPTINHLRSLEQAKQSLSLAHRSWGSRRHHASISSAYDQGTLCAPSVRVDPRRGSRSVEVRGNADKPECSVYLDGFLPMAFHPTRMQRPCQHLLRPLRIRLPVRLKLGLVVGTVYRAMDALLRHPLQLQPAYPKRLYGSCTTCT